MRFSTARLALAASLLAIAAPVGASGGESGGVVPLGTFNVPIVDGGRIDGSLQLALAIAPAAGADAAQLGAAQPAIRAAVLGAVLDFAQLRASPRVAVDADALSRALDAAAHSVDPAAGHVLILEVRTRSAPAMP
ncbi:hypothetical protein ABS767_11475 [Sphingomonas sp. ST-64]|uniref:Uncharacterized protein n=1 Tax=Sphingomonas plantiphila TaxID=3163295 RepID=A0ABW8YMS5_9SPHN